jgi:hypothetical protein
MATCPKCKAKLGLSDLECNNCGYEFPNTEAWNSKDKESRTFKIAFDQFILGLCCILQSLGCLVLFGLVLAFAFHQEWAKAGQALLGLIQLWGLLIVFSRSMREWFPQ